MPQVTVYIRKDDLEVWKNIRKKTEFMHRALNGNIVPQPPASYQKLSPDVVIMDPIPERLANGVCKIHGVPLTDRGKCLQKGCKWA